MNIHHVLIFCCLSALCGGNTGLVSAKLNIYTGAEGGSGTVTCHFSLYGSRKFFCKNKCKAEDILIKTDNHTAQSGRYSIKYKKGSSGKGIVSVTITNLTKSDAGLYRCGLGRTLVPVSYRDFDVRVSNESLPLDVNSRFIRTITEGEKFSYGCFDAVNRSRMFLCKDECKNEEDILIDTDENRAQSGRYIIKYIEGSIQGLYVTIKQVNKSDTGWYRCGYGRALSSDSFRTFQFLVIDAPTASKPNSTLRPFLTSVPSNSTPKTQSLNSSSASFPETTNQFTVFLLPLAVCVFLVVVLSAAVLLLLYKLKTNRNSDSRNMECVTYESPPVSTHEDSIYQSLDPASRDQDQTYSTLK